MATREVDRERGDNGHADQLADADTLKLEPLEWPPPRRRFDGVRRIMTGRSRPSARENDAPLTRVPGWLTGLACSALLIAFTQAGYLIYKLGHADTVERYTERELAGLHDDLRAQDQYNQLVTIYENKIQQLLIQHGIKPEVLPEVPRRPTFSSKRRPVRDEGD